MKKLHEQMRAQIEKVNEQYKAKANKNHIHLHGFNRDILYDYNGSPQEGRSNLWLEVMAPTRLCKR